MSADEPESERRWLQFVSAKITVNEQLPRMFVRVHSFVVYGKCNSQRNTVEHRRLFPILRKNLLMNGWLSK